MTTSVVPAQVGVGWDVEANPTGRPGVLRHTIDPAETASWHLGRRRRDVVAVSATRP
jgi:hypothetical protein